MNINFKSLFIKSTIFIYIIYLLWYTQAIGHSNIFLYGGIILVFIFFLNYINGKRFNDFKVSKRLLYWFFYGIYSLIFGLIVAVDKVYLITSLSTYFAFLFLCISIFIISSMEKDSDWIINYLMIVCLFCALYTIFNGYDYYNGVMVITMGPNNNPNTLGALMVFGMFSVMYKEKKRIYQLLASLVVLLLFFYIIIISGSKKALLSGLIFILIWGIGFTKYIRNKNLNYKLITMIILIITLTIFVYYFSSLYINTSSFERLTGLRSSGSTNIRIGMYKESLFLFKNNPLIGIGYNQFRFLSFFETYSHSTYAELLSGGGIIGTLLFLTPIISTGINLIKNRTKLPAYNHWLYIAIYCVEVFLGTVNIIMYSFMHLLMWTIIYVYVEIES